MTKRFIHFQPTRHDIRGWLVPFFNSSCPWYLYVAAAVPALLLTILLFMDQQITSVIVNRSEHKLRVGDKKLHSINCLRNLSF